MPKHTIELTKEEIRVINVVKAVMDIKSIDKAIAHIINDYANSKLYSKFIKTQRNSRSFLRAEKQSFSCVQRKQKK